MVYDVIVLIPIELQLIRNGLPRSRPTKGFVPLFEETETQWTRLVPGDAAEGMEEMLCGIQPLQRASQLLAIAYVTLKIEGMPFGAPRPTPLFLAETAFPTGIVYFPTMSGARNTMFAGIHCLLLRVTRV